MFHSHISLTNSVALVRERTIPTERPPLVGEVSANFCGKRGVAWSVRRIPYGCNLYFLDRSHISLRLETCAKPNQPAHNNKYAILLFGQALTLDCTLVKPINLTYICI
jgi:hypothetical protein